jgi:SNF2 family DNA or RNA helicase
MAKVSVEEISQAYDVLKDYDGPNEYVSQLKDGVYNNKKTLNDFHTRFILKNRDVAPRFIGKEVMVQEWWGAKKKEEFNLDFVPSKIEIGWYFGEAMDLHVFYARFTKETDKGIIMICSSESFITNFWIEDFRNMEIDLSKYNSDKRTVLPHQFDGVRFLLSRKKCILADEPGGSKTGTAVLGALEGGYEHVLIICPSSVKKIWEYEMSFYVNPDEITIVSGSNWKDNKFTIINYDILDNFYTIPKQSIKSKEVSLDDSGNIVTEYKQKEIVSRNSSIIRAAMDKSQLFQAKYDLIIIDEAHRLSNNTSGRFKIISDLVKRSNPKGIFELTGTMITNSSKNLYNLLKIIDVPVTRNYSRYMERYCGMKSYYKKSERDAYTSMFLKEVHKSSWYALTDEEKAKLNEFLEKKHCKKFYVQGEDQNMEELKEIIKPYYLRRLKSDFVNMVKKDVRCVHYEMTEEEKESYDKLWDEYMKIQEDKDKADKNRKLIEVSLMRQWLADKMIPKTVWLVNKCVEAGRKVVVFCAFDNEIDKLREAFDGYCVYHNGKLNEKKKHMAVERFQNDDSIKVFIGNLQSSGVGLTLTAGSVVVFNNFSFVDAECKQAEDRVFRIGQTKPCVIYYQSFNGTYYDKMLEIIHRKEDVTNKIVVTEKEK